mmetsp:Transcript_17638/g.17853  ORF Transcript_17638/g.17853 Transcript_17638/m.17853 type:complete len:94 (+) Transcript_17638:79-360(+)
MHAPFPSIVWLHLRASYSLLLEPVLLLKPLFLKIQDTEKRHTPKLLLDKNDKIGSHIQQRQPQRKINLRQIFLKHQSATAAALLELPKSTLPR